MDSLTQMVLGAAVGEASLGKKIGNRAMLWGAIAGTIPDLDVIIGNAFMGRLDALVFHRGFMHSILFAILFSFIVAYFVNEFYRKKWYLYKKYRIVSSVFGSLFITLIAGTVTYIMYKLLGQMALYICMIFALFIILFFNKRLWNKYGLPDEQMEIEVSYWSWYKLFFLSIVTHPILDCFTTFGTQLFSPFSDYRVAFNNVSVVDPLYTVPFAFCLFSAAFFSRENKVRTWWNNTGIIVSSAYMCLTLWNKTEVNDVVKSAINSNQLVAERYMTSPTILNNILWNGIIETDSSFYIGQYSFFDFERKMTLKKIPKNLGLLEGKENLDKTLSTLRWFSNGYSANEFIDEGKIQMNDLRYGTRISGPNGKEEFIFSFIIQKNETGEFEMSKSNGGPPRGNEDKMLKELLTRLKGLKK